MLRSVFSVQVLDVKKNSGMFIVIMFIVIG